jgi:hypothetical protein
LTDCEYFDTNRDISYMTCKISDIQGCNTYVASICCRFLEHCEPLRIDLHCRHGLSVLALPRMPTPKLSAPSSPAISPVCSSAKPPTKNS